MRITIQLLAAIVVLACSAEVATADDPTPGKQVAQSLEVKAKFQFSTFCWSSCEGCQVR